MTSPIYRHSVSRETDAEKLLSEARRYDPHAYLYRDEDAEGGLYWVCYRWAPDDPPTPPSPNA